MNLAGIFRSARAATCLDLFVLGVTALVAMSCIYMWRLMPIYPDEVSYRILTARAFFDHFDRISIAQLCESTASLPIPWVFFPAALALSLYSLIENMVHYRAIALGFLTVSFLVLAYSFRLLAAKQSGPSGARASDRRALILLFCSVLLFAAIGVTPAARAVVRPENLIILTLCLVILSLALDPSDRGPLRFFVGAAILLLYAMASYSHPKSLYLVPAVAVSIVRLLIGHSRIAAMGAVAILAWAALAGYRIQKLQFLTCPEVEAIERVNVDNINPLLLFSSPLDFLQEVVRNNFYFEPLRRFFSQPLFQTNYDVHYLPGVEQSSWTLPIANFLIVACVAAVLALALFFLWRHARAMWGALALLRAGGSPDARSARLDAPLADASFLLLYAGILIHLALNRSRNWYDIPFWMLSFSILVAASAAWSWRRGGALSRRLLAVCFAAVALTAILSVYLSFSTIYQDLKKGYAGPSIAVRNYDYDAVTREVDAALAECGLRRDSPRLIVDDYTYPVVQRSYKPIPITYMGDLGWGEGFSRAKRLGSTGMIARCFYFTVPESLASFPLKKHGSLCCLKF